MSSRGFGVTVVGAAASVCGPDQVPALRDSKEQVTGSAEHDRDLTN